MSCSVMCARRDALRWSCDVMIRMRAAHMLRSVRAWDLSLNLPCEGGPGWETVSIRQRLAPLHGRRVLSRPPASGRGDLRRSDRSLRSSVPLHPECRSFIPFRSTPFHSSAAGSPVRRDPNSRVSCAPAPAPAGARFAAARIARLIARARPRTRAGRGAHFTRWPNQGLLRAGADAKKGYSPADADSLLRSILRLARRISSQT